MIRLSLQLFAKSAAYQKSHRKAKAYASGKKIEEELKKEEERKPKQEKKPTRGEKVTAVKAHEEYQVFVYDQEKGKEVPYTNKNGDFVYRTGAQINDKMTYNKGREAWESKAQLAEKKKDGLTKIRRYYIRKRVK